MMSLFNDRYKISLVLSALFILGIGISLFAVYSLPATLSLAAGYQSELTGTYVVIGSTFLLGTITLLFALRYKKEIIVFRDRTLDQKAGAGEQELEGKTTISLDNVIASLSEAQNEGEALEHALHSICKQLDVGQGALYRVVSNGQKRSVDLISGYALNLGESAVVKYEFGEGLIGQSATSGNTLYIDDIPEGYVKIVSGLGSASPRFILIVPMKNQHRVLGILELASFTKINEDQRRFVEEAAALMADKISITA